MNGYAKKYHCKIYDVVRKRKLNDHRESLVGYMLFSGMWD